MTLTRCTFGFHPWDGPADPQFGDRRKCALCGCVDELVSDGGGWTAGFWQRVEGGGAGTRPTLKQIVIACVMWPVWVASLISHKLRK